MPERYRREIRDAWAVRVRDGKPVGIRTARAFLDSELAYDERIVLVGKVERLQAEICDRRSEHRRTRPS